MKYRKAKTLILSLILSFLFVNFPVHASTQDFSFKSFDADYYLEKDSDGISHLKVTETLVAEFPDYDQNHGIERVIPFINQQGKNLTLDHLDSSNLSIKRNGKDEPFSVVKSSSSDYTVRIGSANSFVRGEQTYTLTYTFDKVITTYDDSMFQELYWDTNGTGWHQSFDTLSATIHLPSDIYEAWTKESWCYVGSFGQSGQDRCQIEKTEDGVKFTTKNLKRTENLTFDLQFKDGTFSVPGPKISYLAYYILGIAIVICLANIFIQFARYKTARNNKKLYKSIFVAPEYQPIGDESLQLYSLISIKPLRSSDVATLIQLAINKKIQLEKSEKKSILSRYEWTIHVLSTKDLKKEEQIVLELLNNANPVADGDIIKIKSNRYNSSAAKLQRSSKKHTEKTAKDKNLYDKSTNKKSAIWGLLTFVVFVSSFLLLYFAMKYDEETPGVIIKDELLLVFTPFINIFVVILTITTFAAIYSKFSHSTESSLRLARRLEGLELYIKMAEKERLEFLQSVKNIDTSHQGIVNLHEKLLPYAILFGEEKSWLAELEKYYKFEDVSDTYWIVGIHHLNYRDFNAFRVVSDTAVKSVSASSASSTSSSSSGFSGGGGGGFSGGGGGGGGGGGW